MSKPTENLYADALRVLLYLERTKDLGLRPTRATTSRSTA